MYEISSCMKTFFGSMYEISSYMKTFFGSMYEISSCMKTFFGSMYEISSSMKTFFGSMYGISSYYDRDFLIHEIFISWRFHDPYNAEDNFLSDHLRHQASSTPEWPRNEQPIRTSYWRSESLAKQFPRAHIVDRSRQTGR